MTTITQIRDATKTTWIFLGRKVTKWILLEPAGQGKKNHEKFMHKPYK